MSVLTPKWFMVPSRGVWHRLTEDGVMACSETGRPEQWGHYQTSLRRPRLRRRRDGSRERFCTRCTLAG